MSRRTRRWEGRYSSNTERVLSHQRILERHKFVEIAAELDYSLNYFYRQFGGQKERTRREPVRSPLRLSSAEREEISRGLQVGASYRAQEATHAGDGVNSLLALDEAERIYRVSRAK